MDQLAREVRLVAAGVDRGHRVEVRAPVAHVAVDEHVAPSVIDLYVGTLRVGGAIDHELVHGVRIDRGPVERDFLVSGHRVDVDRRVGRPAVRAEETVLIATADESAEKSGE